MKQFFTALAANLVTIAVCVVAFILIGVGIIASAGARAPVEVRQGSVLIVDLDRPLSDQPSRLEARSLFDDALQPGGMALSLRAATIGIRAAASDDRISALLIRGNVASDGTRSGFAALRELRAAVDSFRVSKKPVHAYLVTPDTRSYYVASVASTITLDPFGTLMLPGLAAEPVFLTGLFEKYGIGVQVSRVGKFKAAVEPFTRRDMSSENRVQTQAYLDDLWSEVKSAIARSRGIDTVALQTLVDTQGMLLPADAEAARLIDRRAYFDVVLDELQRTATGASASDTKSPASDSARTSDLDMMLDRPALPQIPLEQYAPLAMAKERLYSASQVVAVVYAEGDIVDGEGGDGTIGGASLSRELRKLRRNAKVKAVVLRVNSPGGSAIASEQIQRELALIKQQKPVVVSMGSLAASGGYWISTAASRVFAEPNTITGSIGVFSLVPNIQTLANRQGITFDTVKTGRYADLFTIARPRSDAELAVLQRGTDAVYDAFLQRVADARGLSLDSVRAIAEGRVWSGQRAQRLGLVDSLGSLPSAIKSAASLAKITGDYDVQEYPRLKSPTERLTELLEDKPAPVAARASAPNAAASMAEAAAQAVQGNSAAARLGRSFVRELEVLLRYNDPRGVYARMPYILSIQ
jgi:protease IV